MKARFSPVSFKSQKIENSILDEMFEAARWAASSYNEQPWRFVYANKGSESYEKIYNNLMEGNQNWAKEAPVLLFTMAKTSFDHNGKANFHSMHDLGMAVSNFLNKGVDFEIQAHQMGGFKRNDLREAFNIPDSYEIVACMALGYTDETEAEKERKRLDLNQIRNQDSWNF